MDSSVAVPLNREAAPVSENNVNVENIALRERTNSATKNRTNSTLLIPEVNDEDALENDKNDVRSRKKSRFWPVRKIVGAVCCSSCGVIVILISVAISFALKSDKHGIDRDTYFTSRNLPLPSFDNFYLDEEGFSRILSEAIQIPTVSYGDERDTNLTTKKEFGQFLKDDFPVFHSSPLVNRNVVAGASLLYEIPGEIPDLKPYLLISHLDVVPAENAGDWEEDPFSGRIKGDYLYGRGCLDIKSSIIGILMAFEIKLSKDIYWKPRRSIFIFFGHDEETGGHEGAATAAQLLKERGVKLEFILDEGAAALRNYYPGIDSTVCIIGVAEKGFLSVEVEATGDAGHSSMPPDNMAIGNLAQALTKLYDNPLPYHFAPGDLNRKTFEWLAPYFPFGLRLALTNIWLFKPLVLPKMTDMPETRALARTTTAFTIVEGGVKDNVLPKTAKAVVNHRLHPNDDANSVLEWDRRVVKGVEGVKVQMKPGWMNEPSPVAPHGHEDAAYHLIKSSIHSVMSDALVVPYLTPGGTDSKHFVQLTNNIYRFVPYILDKKKNDAKRIHGINERIATKDMANFVKFYWAIIELADHI